LIDKKIGLKIKQIRKSQGLSQIDLAERIGISFQQIQKYEKGKTRISVMRLQQVSDVFEIHIGSFFEQEASAKVSDVAIKYNSKEKQLEVLQSINEEEMTFLRLYRKIKNKKIREGIIKQMQGIVELEKLK